MMPNYLVSASDDAVVLRNYEGLLIRYQAQDKPMTVQQTATRGVSSLLQGTKSVMIPEGNERMARRSLHVISSDHAEEHHEGCGSSAGDGAATGDESVLPMIQLGQTRLNGHANGNGNGKAHTNGHLETLLPVGE